MAIGAERLMKGKTSSQDGLEHLLGGGLFEAGPAEMILLLVEDRVFDRLASAGGFGLLERLELVEALDEEQVGELFDDGERVGDTAGPHGVPDAVDLGFDFAGDPDCVLTVKVFVAILPFGRAFPRCNYARPIGGGNSGRGKSSRIVVE